MFSKKPLKEGGRRFRKLQDHEINKKYQVTVVTVVFNGEKFIRQTIESVLKYRCPKTEYIIIDGSSSDNTVAILNEYNEEIDYWLSEPDKGIYDAMDKGIKQAKGKYTLFLNAQDELVIPIKKLNSVFDLDLALIYGRANLIDSKTNQITGTKGEKINNPAILFSRMPTSHQAIFYRTDWFPGYDIAYKIIADRVATYHLVMTYGLQHTLFIEDIICNYFSGGYSDIHLIRFAEEKITFRRMMHKNTFASELIYFLNKNFRYKYSFFKNADNWLFIKIYRYISQ